MSTKYEIVFSNSFFKFESAVEPSPSQPLKISFIIEFQYFRQTLHILSIIEQTTGVKVANIYKDTIHHYIKACLSELYWNPRPRKLQQQQPMPWCYETPCSDIA